MEVRLARHGNRIIAEPDCVPGLLDFPLWRRHAVYHRICQQTYEAKDAGPPSELTETGIEVLPGLLAAGDGEHLSDLATSVLEEDAENIVGNRADYNDLTLSDAFRNAIIERLPKILSEPTVAHLEQHFGCHFRIDTVSAFRTLPVPVPEVSFLWHRDVAPMSQVHIMVYLTGSGPGSGQTSFLSLAQTRDAAHVGYHYPDIRERSDDIAATLEPTSVTPEVICPLVRPGDGLAFSSARVLHRGHLPSEGFRDVMIIVLLPSFAPWHQDIEDFGTDHMFLHASKSTLKTNPYHPLMPNIEEEMDLNLIPDEPWIIEGELYPPDL